MNLNDLTTDQLEAIKTVLNWLFIAATGGVWLGVFLEKERFKEITRSKGWTLLVVCLAGETLFGSLLWATDSTISRRQKAEIARLEMIVGGRQLTQDAIQSIGKELAPFRGRTVYIVSYVGDAEAARVGLQIKDALELAYIHVENLLGAVMAAKGGISFGMYVSGERSIKNLQML